jgi:hypothetical protein
LVFLLARVVSRGTLPSWFGNGSIIAANVSFLNYQRTPAVADDDMVKRRRLVTFDSAIEFLAAL